FAEEGSRARGERMFDQGFSGEAGGHHWKPAPALMRRLLGYVRPHSFLLAVSLALVAVVGVLEAISPFLIGLVFDTMLNSSSTPTITIPLVGRSLSIASSDGRIFLLILIAITIVKAAAEYGSIG